MALRKQELWNQLRDAEAVSPRARRSRQQLHSVVSFSYMKLKFWRSKRLDPLPEREEREAHKFERRYEEEQGSIRAIFKKMGRENLDDPFNRD